MRVSFCWPSLSSRRSVDWSTFWKRRQRVVKTRVTSCATHRDPLLPRIASPSLRAGDLRSCSPTWSCPQVWAGDNPVAGPFFPGCAFRNNETRVLARVEPERALLTAAVWQALALLELPSLAKAKGAA